MELTIANVGIRQDERGLFCVNDLHRASGGEDRHRPTYWMKNQTFRDLINQLEIDGFPSFESKQGLGTFVCKELVYAYAMWISPAFHLQVIRTFDTIVTNQADPLQALNDPAAMRSLLLTYSEKVIERDKLIAHMQPQVEALHQLEKADGHHNLTTAAKVLNQPPHKFPQALERMGWLYRMGITGPWTGRQEKINSGYLTHKIYRQEMPDGTEKSRAQVLITPKGMARLAVLLKTTAMKQAA